MPSKGLLADDDVVDGDEHELHGETDETHDHKTHSARGGDFLEFLGIGLGALLDQTLGGGHEILKAVDAVADRVVGIGQEGLGHFVDRLLDGNCSKRAVNVLLLIL